MIPSLNSMNTQFIYLLMGIHESLAMQFVFILVYILYQIKQHKKCIM